MKGMSISKQVIDWYQSHGRHNLPWQIDKTLYTVWLSEVMLQQTSVKTVIPYFIRFRAYFPEIYHVAEAPVDKVLYFWSGLGYYARARNFHEAAKIILDKYSGIFPKTFFEIVNLPGIGRSTAGAILSLALGQHFPILDSNVKRVLSRYYGVVQSSNRRETEKHLWSISEKITPTKNVREFNQAIMDLGASLCKPLHPICTICPLNINCYAKIYNLFDYASKKEYKKTMPHHIKWLLVIQQGQEIWLDRRSSDGLWGGLFSFPQYNTEAELRLVLDKYKLNNFHIYFMEVIHHTFSHLHLDMIPIWVDLPISCEKINYGVVGCWYNLVQPPMIGIPAPVDRLLKKIFLFQHSMRKNK
ncbi:A/G-specific adenine glycosylase [Candidatus Erwinia haradaeae]|uniref:Adenine DNA glycosylase n=1 Tax=Candidatus Erwinia haradaeae TaxID=1922217 RepID=A0A451D1T2_9GAMM|nr:A/G-specific adenine glycosylase [Candidatus Erwinia haradaeae]VFP79564.1 Adenine DNA glycosylase [Candidatus Erwinia haradaeae]